MNKRVVKLLSCLMPIRKYRRMFRDKYTPKISVLEDKGKNNRLIILDDGGNETDLKGIENLEIYFEGDNNVIRFYKSSKIFSKLVIRCKSNVFISVGQNCKIYDLNLGGDVSDNVNLTIGDGTTLLGVIIFLCDEPGGKVEIGRDCMFSSYIVIRYSDGHAILDYKTKNPINFPKNVKIGNHCWIGWRANILKGANIPDNSVVGMGSIYTTSSNPDVDCVSGGGYLSALLRIWLKLVLHGTEKTHIFA